MSLAMLLEKFSYPVFDKSASYSYRVPLWIASIPGKEPVAAKSMVNSYAQNGSNRAD